MQIPDSNTLGLLSLIIGLSAYIATVRLWLIEQLRQSKKDSDKAREGKIRRAASWLIWTDASLAVSGVLLFRYGFIGGPEWQKDRALEVFTFAIITLVVHHFIACLRSAGFVKE